MERLDEIRERWEKATAGQWKYHSCSGLVYVSPEFDLDRFDQLDIDIFKVLGSNEDGIAAVHAPADVAALTAAEDLTKRRDDLVREFWGCGTGQGYNDLLEGSQAAIDRIIELESRP